jgi:hypothetical protein
MMLLCPLCHDAATKGALTENEQRYYQAHPHNIEQGYAAGSLKVNQNYCAVATGGVLLVGDGMRITVNGESLLSLSLGSTGQMQLSAQLHDEFDNVLAIIEANEWVSGDPNIWDLEADHQRLTIRQAQRKIALLINSKAQPTRVRARLWRFGQLIDLSLQGIAFNGTAVQNSSIHDLGLVGISIALDTSSRGCKLLAYLGQGAIVSEPDENLRLQKSVKAWYNLSGRQGYTAFMK